MATQKEKNNEEEVKNKKSTKKKTKEVSESSKSAPKAETAKKTSTTTKKKSTTKSSAKKAPPEKNKKSTTKKEKPSTQKNKEKIKEEIVEEPIEENKCKVIKFPMSSDEVNMKNKKCDYKTLAIMTLHSNHTPSENHRYVYKKDILLNKEEIESLSKNQIDTICRNIKKLCKFSYKVYSFSATPDMDIVNKLNNESKDIKDVKKGERIIFWTED